MGSLFSKCKSRPAPICKKQQEKRPSLQIFKVASVYIATTIGAGFASGQEIMQFFACYLKGGFYGIIFSGLLFSIIGFIVLDMVYVNKINDYNQLLRLLYKNKIAKIMEIVSIMFMVSVFCIMIAGAGSILEIKVGLNYNIGIIATALVCMGIIMYDIKGITWLSEILTPLLIIGISIAGLYIIFFGNRSVFGTIGVIEKLTDNWFFSSILYVSYNSILAIVVMCSMLPFLKRRSTGFFSGVIGGFFLCIISLILYVTLILYYQRAIHTEIPLLILLEGCSRYGGLAYTIILWFAMLTTAVSSGFCSVKRINQLTDINIKKLSIGICIIVIPMAKLGFSNLIATVYPAFGYVGLLLISSIVLRWVSPRKAQGHQSVLK